MNIYKKITIFIVLFHSYVYVSSAQERNFIDTNSISGHDFLELEEGFKFCGRDLLDFIKTTKANNPGIDMGSIQLQAQNKIVSILAQDEINKKIFQSNFTDLVLQQRDLNSDFFVDKIEYEYLYYDEEYGPSTELRTPMPVDDIFKFLRNNNSLRPVVYAYLKQSTMKHESFLEPLSMIHHAICNNHSQALQYLENIGYYINDPATPLNLYQPTAWNNAQDALQVAYVIHFAVICNADNALKFLLQKDPVNNKARVNKKDNSGKTPLSLLASSYYNQESKYEQIKSNIGKLLIQAQADIHETNESGDNLLHLAARAENGAIFKLILQQDITLYDKENNNGQIAWDVADSGMRDYLINEKKLITAAQKKQNTTQHVAIVPATTEHAKAPNITIIPTAIEHAEVPTNHQQQTNGCCIIL